MLLSQVVPEVVIIEEVMKQMAAHDPTRGVMYTMMALLVVLFLGSAAAVKYVLTYNREIYKQAGDTIREVAKEHKDATTTLTDTFSIEMAASRNQHSQDMLAAREMVYVARDIAQTASSAKELAEALKRDRDGRQNV